MGRSATAAVLTSVLAICALPCAAGAASADGFARYAIILESDPFGPAAPVATAPVIDTSASQRESEAIARAFKLCLLRQSKTGTKVGFIDISAKPEKTYRLNVGETSDDGVSVLSADMEKRQARLRKDGKEFDLVMAETSSAGGAAPAGMAPTPAAGVPGAAFRSPTAAPNTTALARLKARREAARRVVPPPALSGEALDKRYQELQAEQLRRGGPTLPIPLTKETDDQLVKEGVLPPTEGQEHLAPPAAQPETQPEPSGE